MGFDEAYRDAFADLGPFSPQARLFPFVVGGNKGNVFEIKSAIITFVELVLYTRIIKTSVAIESSRKTLTHTSMQLPLHLVLFHH